VRGGEVTPLLQHQALFGLNPALQCIKPANGSADLQFDVAVVGGNVGDLAAGHGRRQSVVRADHVLERVAVADQQASAAERHRFAPDDRRPGPRHRPVVGRTQLSRVRLQSS